MFNTENMEEIDMRPKLHWTETAMIDEPAWKSRLRQERTELEYALIRLNNFIARPNFKEVVSEKQRSLLFCQQETMMTLYEILGQRICNMDV